MEWRIMIKIIGICGGSASGKTAISRELEKIILPKWLQYLKTHIISHIAK